MLCSHVLILQYMRAHGNGLLTGRCFFVSTKETKTMKKKQAITIIAGEETYKNLASFKNVKDMNDTVRTYKEKFAKELTKNAVRVLDHLQKYSAKYVGVSFRTKNNMAESLGISRRTVIRACHLLESLNIIKQYETKRKSDMQQTSNAIVIQPIQPIDTQDKPKNAEKSHTNKSKSQSLKSNTKNKRNNIQVKASTQDNIQHANFVSHWVPRRFAKLTGSFYQDAKTIQEFWKVVRQCNSVVNFETGKRAFNKEQELQIGLKAVKEFVMKVKGGCKIKNVFGYFNGVVNNLMDKLYFDHEFMGENT